MTTEHDAFAEAVLSRVDPNRPFEPQAHYDPHGDCIEFLVSAEPFYAERIDSLVTVYYSRETGEIVGSLIKGIKRLVQQVLASAPGFQIEIHDGRIRLEHLFTARLWCSKEPPKGSAVFVYKRLREMAERAEVEAPLCVAGS